MKQFNVPLTYRSPLVSAIKNRRRAADKLKKDFSPTRLDLGSLQVLLARHFGFCFGVENAIEIAFRTIEQNPGKRIFLLSEMIHNPQVNADLASRGVQFLQDTQGRELISLDSITSADVVLIPAFGTTLQTEAQLQAKGIPTQVYNTTCPFVEKVWNRSQQIAEKGFSVVIHGKPRHEETRATFSHAAAGAPALVINDMAEAVELATYIRGEKTAADFYQRFQGRYSEGFDPARDLQRFGVVNQTTQLASDTQAIAEYLRGVMLNHYGAEGVLAADRFADTRDTLCYATLDNQSAITGMLETPANLALIVGGYNSSNTTHLVELCLQQLPTYFISSDACLLSEAAISHFDIQQRQQRTSTGWLPATRPLQVLISSGASCPDSQVEAVLRRLAAFFGKEDRLESLLEEWTD